MDGCAALLLGDALQDRRDAESFFHTASLAGRPLLSQIVALLSKPHSNWPLVEGSQHAKQKRDRADLERLATLVREDPKIWSKELIKPHQVCNLCLFDLYNGELIDLKPTIEHVILVSMKAILEHSIWGKDDTCSELVQAGAETLLEELIRAHLEQVPSALETLRRSPVG